MHTHFQLDSTSPILTMHSCPTPLCHHTFDDTKKLSRHKSRYHATPIPVVLQDGTVREIVNLPTGGYVCWCDKKFDIRQSCQDHVRTVHQPMVKNANVFANLKGKYSYFDLRRLINSSFVTR